MDLIARLPALRRDRSRQAAPQVFENLRELIVDLELPPGAVLPRAELAQHFGVSQTPVRDALLKLGEEGLVEIYPQHATLVSRIDIAAALRAHFLRRALELELLQVLASGSAAVLAPLVHELDTHVKTQARAARSRDFSAFTAADRDFHRALFDAAGMGDLYQLARQRSGHVDRLRRLHLPAKGKAQAVIRDHKAIIQALQARDPAAAQSAVRTHLAGTLAFVDEVRKQHPHWVSG